MFSTRSSAGRELGEHLAATGRYGPDTAVLGLPRGGIPVAAAVADAVGGSLDVIVVRKLGTPANPELAMGAIGHGGGLVLDEHLIASLGISPAQVRDVVTRERDELERRERIYRGDRAPVAIRDRDVVLVDDGIATGSSMQAAIDVVDRAAPASVTVAAPVAPASSIRRLESRADHIEILMSPEPFVAVGMWYRDFTQTTDDEVRTLLAAT